MADLNPDWRLDGKDVDVRIGAALSTTDYTLSVESTLAVQVAVRDQERVLLKSGLLDANKDSKLDQGVELALDGALYRLALVKKTGNLFTLGFEDRVAARLRDAKGQMKARAGENHVRFAKRLVTLVGGEFVTPTGVAVATDGTALEHKRARADADDRRERGIADEPHTARAASSGGGPSGTGTLDQRLTVAGAPITAEQIRNAEILLGVAAKEQAGVRPTEAIIVAAIGESGIRDIPNAAGSPYGGVLQARKDRGLSTAQQAHYFMVGGQGYQADGAIAAAKQNPSWSPGRIAVAVEGSRSNFRSDMDAEHHYQQHIEEARAIIDAYGGAEPSGEMATDAGVTPGTTAATLTPTKVLVQRGTPDEPNESSWDALQRISKGKGYRCFALRNRVYYGREQDFLRSRPRMTISENSPGVDWIDWEWSPRKAVNVATVQCRASLWAAPPCSAVIFKDCGAADGRWLVSSFKRSRDSKAATIELRRGTELLQPPKTKESTGPVSQAGENSVKAVCKTISDQGRRYLYGGGHGKKLDDITGSEPLDCSSSCSLALKLAGVFPHDTAWVSGQFASSYGEAGRGKSWTIWANSEHVFIMGEGKNPEDNWRFDTGGPGGGEGPRLRLQRRPTDGFTPRRVKGDG